MFFIGIFGIQQKEKQVTTLEDLDCKGCGTRGRSYLIKNYTYFHIFFIPIYKWNINYYVICEGCNKIFSIPKEKGQRAEKGEKNAITYWDLKDIGYTNGIRRCHSCNREVNIGFEYCPYCGSKLK